MLKAILPHSEEDFLLIPKCGVMVETKLGQQKWNKKRQEMRIPECVSNTLPRYHGEIKLPTDLQRQEMS